MIADALQWLKDKTLPLFEEVNGKQFCQVKMIEVKPEAIPYPATLDVFTLDALCNLIDKKVDELQPEKWLLHVVNEVRVDLIALEYDTEYGRRRTLAKATPPQIDSFKFGQYYDPDTFAIKIQADFTDSTDRSYIQTIAANITSETVTISQDDGISQQIGLRQGVHLQGSDKMRSRVTLAPFRTFIEVEQPASEFIFRAKQEQKDSLPKLALFEADGGKWRLAAIQNIADYLRHHATGVQVIS